MSTQLTRQEQLFGEVEERYGTVSIPNKDLWKFVRLVKTVDDEARLHVDSDGLSVRLVDPANVGLVDVRLDVDLDTADFAAGVNVKELHNHIQNKPRTSNNSVDVELDISEPYGTVSVNEEINECLWTFTDTFETLDLEMVREEPDPVDTEFTMSVEFPVNRMYKWLTQANTGNPIVLRVEDETLVCGELVGQDEFGRVVTLDDVNAEDGEALYSSDYLPDAFKALNAVGIETVEMRWADEYPCELHFRTDTVSGHFMLAPRIKA